MKWLRHTSFDTRFLNHLAYTNICVCIIYRKREEETMTNLKLSAQGVRSLNLGSCISRLSTQWHSTNFLNKR